MPRHLVLIVATVFVMLFLWLSAVPLLSWYEFSAHHQELQDATFQWSRHELKNYDFEVGISADHRPPQMDPIRIHVRDATFLAAYRIDDDEIIDIAALADVPDTIDASYEFISRLLEEWLYDFSAEYDATFAYPKRLQFAGSDESQTSLNYHIRRFGIVPDSPR